MPPADGPGTAKAGPGPWLIAIAASAGGIRAIGTILGSLPKDLPAAVVVVQHRTPDHANVLLKVLRRRSLLPVVDAAEGQEIQPATVYVARADSHLTIAVDRTFHYLNGGRICFVRSSANPLFESAARVFDGHLVAVVLTGGGHDATDGVQGVQAHGGHVIAQDPETSQHRSMPSSAIKSGAVDYVLPLDAIGPAVDDIVHGRPISIPSPQ
jgi:two-component system, chemotaxis family, protein-glutamate methylesterase/glutaminase